ncbi:MAG: hypothetical protein RSE44_27410, partial [Pseudomonas sp.]
VTKEGTTTKTTFISSWLNHRVMMVNDAKAGTIVLQYVAEKGETTMPSPVVIASPSGALVPTLKKSPTHNPFYIGDKTWTYTIDIMKRDATTMGPGVSIKSTTITCQQIGN